MPRPRVWTGSRWADAQVWNGTKWVTYTPPVYGANAHEDYFDGGLNGWTGDGYNGYPIQWSGGVAYVDYDASPYGLDCEIRRDWAEGAYVFSAPPATEIRMQASVWVAILSGNGAEADVRQLYLSSQLKVAGFTQTLSWNAQLGTSGNGGYVAYATTTNYTTPDTGAPVECNLLNMQIRFDGGGLAIPTNPPKYRLHVDWARLIGPDGNPLKKMTAAPVDPIKVWNGSAWV